MELPDRCPGCGFGNVNIWGTRIGEVTQIEVRCMRCGSPQSKKIVYTPTSH